MEILTPENTYMLLLSVQAAHLLHHRLAKRHISFAEVLSSTPYVKIDVASPSKGEPHSGPSHDGGESRRGMAYSEGFRLAMVARLTGPDRVSAWALSQEVGLPESTLSRWLARARLHR